MKKIILINPHGFCAGVKRAIETVEKALEIFDKPIYVNHPIVHNEYVVRKLEEKGAVFGKNLDEIPSGSVFILSAHGAPPFLYGKAKKRNLRIIDATCPLVAKIHFEAIKYHKEGYSIIIIGHKNHQEIIGIMGEAPMYVVENAQDVDNLILDNSDKVIYLMQTTLSIDDAAGIINKLKEKYPQIIAPPKDDICYATQNRQNAVKKVVNKIDLLLVIGSQNSSNSNRLVEVAKGNGLDAYLISNETEINDTWFDGVDNIGITSGASTPDILVESAIERIKNIFGNDNIAVENYNALSENMNFSLPRELN